MTIPDPAITFTKSSENLKLTFATVVNSEGTIWQNTEYKIQLFSFDPSKKLSDYNGIYIAEEPLKTYIIEGTAEQTINYSITDIDLSKDRYVIDAKSTIGIFTLNLSHPVNVEIHSNDKDEVKRFNEMMEEFV